MRFDKFPSFPSGSMVTRDYDVVIDGGEIRKRKKKPSKQFRDEFGHTPLSIEEDIPWKCRRLVVGTGAYGRLLMMKEVKREADAAKSNCSWSQRPKPLKRWSRAPRRRTRSCT